MTENGRTSRKLAKAPVSKTGEPKGLEGSTPSPSAQLIEQGNSIGATHLIIVCNDQETYPVYVMPENNLQRICERLKPQIIQQIISLKT